MGRIKRSGRGGGKSSPYILPILQAIDIDLCRGWMMANLLEQKGASSGECLEVGVWWCKKV